MNQEGAGRAEGRGEVKTLISHFFAMSPLHVMDLEVLGTHQLLGVVFWVGRLVKNLSFARSPSARAALKIFFCAREGSWTWAKANKLVFHHAGVGFLCFPPCCRQSGFPMATNVSTSNLHLQTCLSGQAKKLVLLPCGGCSVLCAPACSSFECFSSWLLQGWVLWGFSSSPVPPKQLRTRLRDAVDMGSVCRAD